MVGLSYDITDRKQAALALKDSEERYRPLFDRNLAVILRTSMDGHIVDCDAAMARILVYSSREEFLGSDLFSPNSYFHPEDQKRFLQKNPIEAVWVGL